MNEKNLFMGCDPGCSGCFVLLDREGCSVEQIRMDKSIADIGAAVTYFSLRISFALIEQVHSMPKQGVASSFKFGDAYGIMRGMVTMAKIRHQYVAPSKWQQAMGCRSKGDKNVTKAVAQRLFPTDKIIHRNADAFLLAELARRTALERGW